MENKSHAFITGLFTIALSIAVVLTALYLNRDNQVRVPYLLSTTQSVAGLNPQAAVRYRGMDVGKVESITFHPDKPGVINVRIGVVPSTPITTDTFAELGMQGVTGLAFVQLNQPEGTQAKRLDTSEQKPAELPLRASLFDRLSVSGESMFTKAGESMERVNRLLGDDNQKAIAGTLTGMQAMVGKVDRLADGFAPLGPAYTQVASDARRAIATSDKAIADMGKLAREVTTKLEAIDRITKSVAGVEQSMAEISVAVKDVGDTATAVRVDTLPRVNVLAGEVGAGVRNVSGAAEKLAEEPNAVLYGTSPPKPGPGEAGFSAPAAGARAAEAPKR
jgi:phospholipid/cholesterol/gamma-HCH transport system substrate-binding protein